MNDVLTTYLKSGLLDIGDDDNRLTLLQSASEELSTRFIEEPREALYHALTLYSPAPSADDATFSEAGTVLVKHWTTYRNRFKENPREILKPVSFRALQLAADANEDLSLALGFLLRTVPAVADPTREQEVLAEFIRILDDGCEAEALNMWAVPDGKVKAIGVVPVVTVTKIDRDALAAQIVVAAGPQNAQGQVVTGANPNWPQGSAAWSGEFAKQLSEAVASAIEQALLKLTKELPKGTNVALGEANARLASLSEQAAIAKRAQLIWWEKSAFSSRLRKPYAELPSGINVVAMVIDFYEISGHVAPYSAESFLRNTIASICGTQPLKTSELIAAGRSLTKELFCRFPIQFEDRAGAKTVVESMLAKASDSGDSKRHRAEKVSESATPAKHAIRLFNELQALSLAHTARPMKK
jgi:hypothetical protein